MNVTFSNKPNQVDFDLSKVSVSSNYNIIFHYVYDPFSHFESEFAFLHDPALNENTLVILWHPVEMGTWDQHWINKLNAVVSGRKFKLLYLTGCTDKLDLHQHFDIKFDYQFFPVFDLRASILWAQIPAEVTTNKQNKYVCLNSKDSAHRRYVFSQLHAAGLLDQGIVSYRCANWNNEFNTEMFNFREGQGFTPAQVAQINQSNQSLLDVIPISIDKHDVASSLPRSVFTDSYVNIVNETDFINVPMGYRRSFVTEKTFNAIANNQMFIVAGHAGSLALLHSLGYQTFSDVIDESYDTIEHNGDRLIAVTQEIVKFLSRPLQDIQQDYTQMLDVITHNKKLLYSQSLNTRLQAAIDQYQ